MELFILVSVVLMYINHSLLQLSAFLNLSNHVISKKDSQHFTTLQFNLELGFSITTTKMYAWNPLTITTSLYTMYQKGYISNIVVANPKWIRAVKGEKDDDKDARWIADLFKLNIVNGRFIPSSLVQIAHAVIKDKEYDCYANKFSRISKKMWQETCHHCHLSHS